MILSEFENDLKQVRDFGKERINGFSFSDFISGDEDYFELMQYLFASMLPWKKHYHTNQVMEKFVFLYRRLLSSFRGRNKQYSSEKGNVFFFPISETNTIFIEPIITKLSQYEDVRVFRFDYSLNGLKGELEKRKISYVNYENYLDKRIVKISHQIRNKYKDALEMSYKILEKNKNYERMRPALKYFFGGRNRFYELIEFVEVFKNFIEVEKPSMVVLCGENMDVSRAISYLCKKNKIPCIFFQDGNVYKNTQDSGETFATKKIVFGEAGKRLMIKKGMPADKIIVTGSPLYDVLIRNKITRNERDKIKSKLGLNHKKVILFASTTNLEGDQKRLRILYEISKKNPSIKIVIKQHPGEYNDKKYENFFKNLAKEYGVEVIVNKDDMYKMLRISDVFIADFSTTILEALLLKIPMILTNFENLYEYESYPEFKGLIWHAYNFDDVNNAIKYIIENKYSSKQERFRKKLIKEHLYKDDGKSTERVVKLIRELKIKN